MTSRVRHDRGDVAEPADDLHALYLELLDRFYENGDRRGAARVAERLETALADRPEVARSIRGEEIRSLLAELRGDLDEAVRSREGEVRKILELHSTARDTPAWDYVRRRYDYADVSDRLDLLASLHAERGDLDRAVATLEESRQFCRSHQVPFDGQDLLDEFERERQALASGGPLLAPPEASIDAAIRAAYAKLLTPSDEILVDDEAGRRFSEEVNRRLPRETPAPIKEIKKRLLKLSRRGESRGGLPRLPAG